MVQPNSRGRRLEACGHGCRRCSLPDRQLEGRLVLTVADGERTGVQRRVAGEGERQPPAIPATAIDADRQRRGLASLQLERLVRGERKVEIVPPDLGGD